MAVSTFGSATSSIFPYRVELEDLSARYPGNKERFSSTSPIKIELPAFAPKKGWSRSFSDASTEDELERPTAKALHWFDSSTVGLDSLDSRVLTVFPEWRQRLFSGITKYRRWLSRTKRSTDSNVVIVAGSSDASEVVELFVKRRDSVRAQISDIVIVAAQNRLQALRRAAVETQTSTDVRIHVVSGALQLNVVLLSLSS